MNNFTDMHLVLMIAFDYPPCTNAAVQRTLKFSQYLPLHSWQPIVLTSVPSAYENKDTNQIVPKILEPYVYRAFVLDSARFLTIKGKYFGWTRIPDRWWTWIFDGFIQGRKLIKTLCPEIIWSTYPYTTTHLLAYLLHRFSGLPWVADFRDPVQFRYDKSINRYTSVFKWIEEKTIINCTKAIFTTKKAEALYRNIYPEYADKFITIENGCELENNKTITGIGLQTSDRFKLLYSGYLYPNGRDPLPLFNALADLKKQDRINKTNFVLMFRGAGTGNVYANLLKDLDIDDLVEFYPAVSFQESIQEMMEAEALLVIQGELFNNQIPGKIYEYISAKKPILALTSAVGATAELLADIPNAICAERVEEVSLALKQMLDGQIIDFADPKLFSRKMRTEDLAHVLNNIVNEVKKK
jgi:glycosyltransferase involved in cell wall biosynthesis